MTVDEAKVIIILHDKFTGNGSIAIAAAVAKARKIVAEDELRNRLNNAKNLLEQNGYDVTPRLRVPVGE